MMPSFQYCPSTLSQNHESYSEKALIALFDGAVVSPILPFDAPQHSEIAAELFLEQRKRISVSGVQEKISLRLESNNLRLLHKGEQGTHILKPIPKDLRKVSDIPANEHLTMQIAAQVYGIATAANAMIFFQDGTPAYLTRRFDVQPDGTKWAIEDFATLAGKSERLEGAMFKYDYSYEKMGYLIQQYTSQPENEILIYFKTLIFNYLFSNGDAHLKNFSLLEQPNHQYVLSPAYDLLNTKIHVDDTNFALRKGLFEQDNRSVYYRNNGQPTQRDFLTFAEKMNIAPSIAQEILAPFIEKQTKVETLLQRSFLSESSKNAYLIHYNTKHKHLAKK
jgi:serine/threonine-protein kinase HipA